MKPSSDEDTVRRLDRMILLLALSLKIIQVLTGRSGVYKFTK